MKALQKKKGLSLWKGGLVLLMVLACMLGFLSCSDGNSDNSGTTGGNGEGGDKPPVTEIVAGPFVSKIEVLQNPTRPSGVGGMVDLWGAKFRLTWVNADGSPNKVEDVTDTSEFYSDRLANSSKFPYLYNGTDVDVPGYYVLSGTLSTDYERMIDVRHIKALNQNVYASVVVPAVFSLERITVTGWVDTLYEDDRDIPRDNIQVMGYYNEREVKAYNLSQANTMVTNSDGTFLPITVGYRQPGFPAAVPAGPMPLPPGVPSMKVSGNEVWLIGLNTPEFEPTKDPKYFTVPLLNYYEVDSVNLLDVDWKALNGGDPWLDTMGSTSTNSWISKFGAAGAKLKVTYKGTSNGYTGSTSDTKERTWDYFESAYRDTQAGLDFLAPAKPTNIASTVDFSVARNNQKPTLDMWYFGKKVTNTEIPTYKLASVELKDTKATITLPGNWQGKTVTAGSAAEKGAILDVARQLDLGGYELLGNYQLGAAAKGGTAETFQKALPTFVAKKDGEEVLRGGELSTVNQGMRYKMSFQDSGFGWTSASLTTPGLANQKTLPVTNLTTVSNSNGPNKFPVKSGTTVQGVTVVLSVLDQRGSYQEEYILKNVLKVGIEALKYDEVAGVPGVKLALETWIRGPNGFMLKTSPTRNNDTGEVETVPGEYIYNDAITFVDAPLFIEAVVYPNGKGKKLAAKGPGGAAWKIDDPNAAGTTGWYKTGVGGANGVWAAWSGLITGVSDNGRSVTGLASTETVVFEDDRLVITDAKEVTGGGGVEELKSVALTGTNGIITARPWVDFVTGSPTYTALNVPVKVSDLTGVESKRYEFGPVAYTGGTATALLTAADNGLYKTTVPANLIEVKKVWLAAAATSNIPIYYLQFNEIGVGKTGRYSMVVPGSLAKNSDGSPVILAASTNKVMAEISIPHGIAIGVPATTIIELTPSATGVVTGP